MLPRALWVEILSFTHRNWFDVPMNEVDFLKRRLAEEQANVQRANQANQEAETRCRLAERERDVYKMLARSLRSRLNSSAPDRNNNADEIEAETALEMILGGRESFSTFGLGRMLPLVAQQNGDEEMREDGDEHSGYLEEENDDDDDDMSEVMDDVDDYDDEEDSDDDESLSVASDHPNFIVDSNATMSGGIRSESRTVSISEEVL
jgi:hypothetical protein